MANVQQWLALKSIIAAKINFKWWIEHDVSIAPFNSHCVNFTQYCYTVTYYFMVCQTLNQHNGHIIVVDAAPAVDAPFVYVDAYAF